MDIFMRAAVDEARQGLAEGGIPIGSVLVRKGKILGRGHNRRVQNGSVILCLGALVTNLCFGYKSVKL